MIDTRNDENSKTLYQNIINNIGSGKRAIIEPLGVGCGGAQVIKIGDKEVAIFKDMNEDPLGRKNKKFVQQIKKAFVAFLSWFKNYNLKHTVKGQGPTSEVLVYRLSEKMFPGKNLVPPTGIFSFDLKKDKEGKLWQKDARQGKKWTPRGSLQEWKSKTQTLDYLKSHNLEDIDEKIKEKLKRIYLLAFIDWDTDCRDANILVERDDQGKIIDIFRIDNSYCNPPDAKHHLSSHQNEWAKFSFLKHENFSKETKELVKNIYNKREEYADMLRDYYGEEAKFLVDDKEKITETDEITERRVKFFKKRIKIAYELICKKDCTVHELGSTYAANNDRYQNKYFTLNVNDKYTLLENIFRFIIVQAPLLAKFTPNSLSAASKFKKLKKESENTEMENGKDNMSFSGTMASRRLSFNLFKGEAEKITLGKEGKPIKCHYETFVFAPKNDDLSAEKILELLSKCATKEEMGEAKKELEKHNLKVRVMLPGNAGNCARWFEDAQKFAETNGEVCIMINHIGVGKSCLEFLKPKKKTKETSGDLNEYTTKECQPWLTTKEYLIDYTKKIFDRLFDAGIKPENTTGFGFSIGGFILTQIYEMLSEEGKGINVAFSRTFHSLVKLLTSHIMRYPLLPKSAIWYFVLPLAPIVWPFFLAIYLTMLLYDKSKIAVWFILPIAVVIAAIGTILLLPLGILSSALYIGFNVFAALGNLFISLCSCLNKILEEAIEQKLVGKNLKKIDYEIKGKKDPAGIYQNENLRCKGATFVKPGHHKLFNKICSLLRKFLLKKNIDQVIDWPNSLVYGERKKYGENLYELKETLKIYDASNSRSDTSIPPDTDQKKVLRLCKELLEDKITNNSITFFALTELKEMLDSAEKSKECSINIKNKKIQEIYDTILTGFKTPKMEGSPFWKIFKHGHDLKTQEIYSKDYKVSKYADDKTTAKKIFYNAASHLGIEQPEKKFPGKRITEFQVHCLFHQANMRLRETLLEHESKI